MVQRMLIERGGDWGEVDRKRGGVESYEKGWEWE